MRVLIAVAAGIAVTVGVGVALTGLTRTPAPASVHRWPHWVTRSRTHSRSPGFWGRWRWPVTATLGVLVWLVTGLPVAAGIAAVTVIGLPVLLSTSRVAARAIDRIEAVEAWTRRLADVLVVGVGLEQAIAATVATCPPPIAAEVEALGARLDAHWSTEDALRAWADDINDATGDLIAAALILAARRRGPGLPRVLSSLADSVADEIVMRRKVEAERAKPRTTARAVTLITLTVVALGALNTTYLQPYTTPVGQLVLAGITVVFVTALAWMRTLTLTTPAPRFLNSRTTTSFAATSSLATSTALRRGAAS